MQTPRKHHQTKQCSMWDCTWCYTCYLVRLTCHMLHRVVSLSGHFWILHVTMHHIASLNVAVTGEPRDAWQPHPWRRWMRDSMSCIKAQHSQLWPLGQVRQGRLTKHYWTCHLTLTTTATAKRTNHSGPWTTGWLPPRAAPSVEAFKSGKCMSKACPCWQPGLILHILWDSSMSLSLGNVHSGPPYTITPAARCLPIPFGNSCS